MNGARNQLLSSSILTGYEDTRICGCYPMNDGKDFFDLIAFTKNASFSFYMLLQFFVLFSKFCMLQCIADGHKKFVSVKRLGEKIKRTKFGRLHCCLNGTMTGDHHNRQLFILLPNFRQHFDAIHAGHFYIQ